MYFFKLIKVHLLVSELYIYQNARCNDQKKKRPGPFRDFTQSRTVVSYRLFGTTYRPHLQGSSRPRRNPKIAQASKKYQRSERGACLHSLLQWVEIQLLTLKNFMADISLATVRSVHMVYLCVAYDSQNELRLFH